MGHCERGAGPTEVLEEVVALLPEVIDIPLDHQVSITAQEQHLRRLPILGKNTLFNCAPRRVHTRSPQGPHFRPSPSQLQSSRGPSLSMVSYFVIVIPAQISILAAAMQMPAKAQKRSGTKISKVLHAVIFMASPQNFEELSLISPRRRPRSIPRQQLGWMVFLLPPVAKRLTWQVYFPWAP